MYDVDHGSCCSGPCNNHGHALRDTTGKQSWVLRAEMKEPGDLLYVQRRANAVRVRAITMESDALIEF